MPGSTARASRKGASSISRWMKAKRSGSKSSTGATCWTPALFTKMSTRRVGQPQRVDRVAVGQVGDQVLAAEVGGHLPGAGLVAVQHHDVRAQPGEPLGHGAADAARAAGHQRGPAVQRPRRLPGAGVTAV